MIISAFFRSSRSFSVFAVSFFSCLLLILSLTIRNRVREWFKGTGQIYLIDSEKGRLGIRSDKRVTVGLVRVLIRYSDKVIR